MRMVQALQTLGMTVKREDSRIIVHGGDLGGNDCIVDAGLAGTTSRFMIALSVLRRARTTVVGDGALSRRPMGELVAALRQLGASIVTSEHSSLPVSIDPRKPKSSDVTIRGDVSSQFISALMLIAPYLSSGLTIHVSTPLVSRPYVEMTAAVMNSFGVPVSVSDYEIRIPQSRYEARMFDVEPDYSSAAFPVMATAIRGGVVRIPGLACSEHQGDSVVLDITAIMGCDVSVEMDDVLVGRDSSSRLRPFEADLRDASDLVPPVVVAAAFADGVSRISGIGFIRGKESDRLGDLAHELRRLGADIAVLDDGLEIRGNTVWREGIIDAHHDHRLAMALALVALSGVRVGVNDPDVVDKSWPSYWHDMAPILGARS